MDFRHDINGLRALAVIAVVLYHFGVPAFSGGFAGVDIFFVISGYLMTGILLSRPAGSLGAQIAAFYLARARRIIPALAALCLVLLTAGWFFLSPYDYRELAQHVGSSALFLSNHVYLNEAGYFDADAREKWLLHTWSLSVEWQFYLIYPLVILLGRRVVGSGRRRMAGLLIALTLLSFALALWWTESRPAAAFFVLPTRAWEMLSGGLAYLLADHWRNAAGAPRFRWLEVPGLLLIAAALLLIDEGRPWPGFWALLPVLGAWLVIVAGNNERSGLGWLPLRLTGLWSYSIYLWHWPLVVALDKAGLLDVWPWKVAGVVASFLLGWLSYVLVEQSFRRISAGRSPKRLAVMALALVAVAFVLAWLVYRGDGLRDIRFAGNPALPAVKVVEQYPRQFRARHDQHYRSGTCFLNGQLPNENFADACRPQAGAWLLWGDSHGAHLWPGFAAQAISTRVGQLTVSGCPPLIGIDFPKRPECRRLNDAILREVKARRPAVLILAGAWVSYSEETIAQGLQATLDALAAEAGWRPVIVLVGSVPHWKRSLPRLLASDLLMGQGEVRSGRGIDPQAGERDRFLQSLAEQHRIRFFSPLQEVCAGHSCPRYFGEGKLTVPFATDRAHLSDLASRQVVDALLAAHFPEQRLALAKP